jgi:hypothetical protein
VEAVAFSALIAAYLLVPHALFRFVLSFFLPVRAIEESKTEEITRAVATLLFFFILATVLVHWIPFFETYPWPFRDTPEIRKFDYVTVLNGLHSETLFKDYGQTFWNALFRTLQRQGRMLVWYYVVVGIAAALLGFLSKYYGWMRTTRFAWFGGLYVRFLLPHISQWHPILSGFTFAGKTTIKADVLMSNDVLYSGEVAEYFLNRDGSLGGLFLKNPRRFERERYIKEREEWGLTRDREKFWRNIPSAKLYLIGSRIVNVNLRYEGSDATILQKFIANYLKATYAGSVVVRPPQPPRPRLP